MSDYECCGKCRYHLPAPDRIDNCDFICDCEDSEYYTDYTGYSDSCDEFEER